MRIVASSAKDRMRSEDGNNVTIVRADLKKMYMLDMKAKTVSAEQHLFCNSLIEVV